MAWYAKCELPDSDWKTQLAKGYGDIPKGAQVTFEGTMQNFYGYYAKVRYNGILYYVPPGNIEFREEQEEK